MMICCFFTLHLHYSIGNGAIAIEYSDIHNPNPTIQTKVEYQKERDIINHDRPDRQTQTIKETLAK